MAELTTGERIAVKYAHPAELKLCADTIDKAITKAVAEAREEGRQDVLKEYPFTPCSCLNRAGFPQAACGRCEGTGNATRSPVVKECDQLKKQLAAKEAEAGALREALAKLLCKCQYRGHCPRCHLNEWGLKPINDDNQTLCGRCEQLYTMELDKECVRCAALASNAGADMLARLADCEAGYAELEASCKAIEDALPEPLLMESESREAAVVALLAGLREAEKARDEHLHYIQYDLNVQIEAANDAIAETIGDNVDDWESIASAIRLIGERLRAAEEKAAALDWLSGYLKHGQWEAICIEGHEVDACHFGWANENPQAAIGSNLLAAIQAARAEEPK